MSKRPTKAAGKLLATTRMFSPVSKAREHRQQSKVSSGGDGDGDDTDSAAKKKYKRKPRPDVEPVVFTISTFCVAHEMSEAHYFALKLEDLQPKEGNAGGKIFITFEAAAEWRARCERGEIVTKKMKEERKKKPLAQAPVLEPSA